MNQSVKTWAAFTAQLLLGAAILLALLGTIDVAALSAALARMQPSWLVMALVLSILGTIVLPAMVTRRALEIERVRMSLWELIAINLAIRLYVLILPRAMSIGIRWMRYRRGGSGLDALALMVFERLVQLFAMVLVASVVLPFEFATLGRYGAVAFAVSVSATAIIGATIMPFVVPATAAWLERLCARSDRLAPQPVARQVRRLLDSVRAFQSLRSATTRDIVLISLLGYVLFILSAYAVVIAMRLDVSLAALAWIRALVFLMTLLPFTVGGLGVREAGFIGLLGLYGLQRPEALAFSLTIFGVQVCIGLMGAVAEAWTYWGDRHGQPS